MATNTTGKVNLGQEGKPTYYNCVLHVYAPIEKIWKFNEKSLSHMSYRTDGEFIKVRFIYSDEEIHLPSPTSEKGKCQILFNSIFVKKSKLSLLITISTGQERKIPEAND